MDKQTVLIIIGVSVVLFVSVFIFAIIKNKQVKKERREKRKEDLEIKSQEVEMLKLTVEKEKLQAELDEMKAPKFVYCKYCKTKNDADAKRCFKCGVGFEEY